MKKLLATMAAVAALCVPSVALAEDPKVVPYSLEAMGCMKLRECTDQVYPLRNMDLMREHFPGQSYTMVDDEADELLSALDRAGIRVYLAAGHHFPRSHRGSYYTDTNTFFLNANHMWDQYVFINVLRHEAWHAAQDCMAGNLENSMLAVIYNEEDVPEQYRQSAAIRYRGDYARAVPWEQEAIWAGYTENMSLDAINVCADGDGMWNTYEPTPMTREWLEAEGYIE